MPPRIALLALLLVGCVRTQSIPLGASVTRAAVAADAIVIYRTAEQVPGKFVEVAMLTANGWASRQLPALRKKAGALGANAILLVSTERPTTSTVTSGYREVATVESGSSVTTAVAIYVTP